MRKFNFFFSIVFTITLPLMIMILSSSVVLRMSETYHYHFNDSEVLTKINYSIEAKDMSSAIISYWSPFNNEEFQVYEKNGSYRDPVFKNNEQEAMSKIKNVLNIELLLGLIFGIINVGIYVYFIKKKFKEVIRKRFFIGAGILGALILANVICFSIRGFRLWLYGLLIGVELSKKSTIAILIGDPFFKTYLLFTTVFELVLLGLYLYINHKYTKPDRIFY